VGPAGVADGRGADDSNESGNEEPALTKAEVRARIEEIGILPAIRVSAPERARFAVEAVNRAGIPLAEITMTIPKAIDIIYQMAKLLPDMVIGAGTVLDTETARRCVDAGARFLSSPGFVPEVVEFALKNDAVVFPGALTPTEAITAWKAGSDFVKIFPCAQVGGYVYIRTLKVPLPQIKLIASGGVNQQTAFDFILAGASALGIGGQLIPPEALSKRKEAQVQELARRFLNMVKDARAQKESMK
jgi:2-dehydro-3-deoxyphosphogluconate aldolase/(4S)-4-hydroxy-2-oxoglutarate aldolase